MQHTHLTYTVYSQRALPNFNHKYAFFACFCKSKAHTLAFLFCVQSLSHTSTPRSPHPPTHPTHPSTLPFLQVRFVVMNNVFRTDLDLHRKFDLKGSTHGRTAGPRASHTGA